MDDQLVAATGAPRESRREVGGEELAQGLLLMRASAMKVVRLQLAMERNDRRLALETVDDLVVLDRKIEDFLSDIPASADRRAALERELEQQRQALMREKFTLAAGMSGRIAGDEPEVDRDMSMSVTPTAAETGVDPTEPANDFLLADPFEDVVAGRRGRGLSSRAIAAGLMIAIALAGLLILALLRPDLIGMVPWLEGVW